MKVVKFKECNVVLGGGQPEYLPLPAHRDKNGLVTSCWGLNWKERIIVLFTGKVYLQLMTFNTPIQPQRMSVSIKVEEA